MKNKFFMLFSLCLGVSLFVSNSFAKGPFFYSGDGRIKIKNSHNGKVVDVVYMDKEGTLSDQSFAKIDSVFGFPTQDKGENISRRLIAMLDYFSDLVAPDKTIKLVSGYRSPSYNQSLRDKGRIAAKTSTHIDGMAIDFSLSGVNGKELWELIRSKKCCGVGNYGSSIVHLDAGRPRFWEAATSKVDTGASDFNRYIYISPEYDRYEAGEQIRFVFTSVSDFGFGVLNRVSIVSDEEGNNEVLQAEIKGASDKCVIIKDRKASRFLYVSVPKKISQGRYRVKIDFCQRPSEEMPKSVVSGEFEIK